MVRSMGDATHANIQALIIAGTEMVAGYVTGSPDVKWTADDFASFPGRTLVTIDQGFTGSPVMTANVRDVESFAWTAAQAVDKTGWTAPVPTLYSAQVTLKQLIALGWTGAVWLAAESATIPSAPPGHLFDGTPIPATIQIVAQQYMFDVNNAYDLSVVFDPFWPERGPAMPNAWQAGSVRFERSQTASSGWAITGIGDDNIGYIADINADKTTGPLVALTAPLTFAPIIVSVTGGK